MPSQFQLLGLSTGVEWPRCWSLSLLDSRRLLLTPLSLPAGTGNGPYQFTSLGQATAEFSKPLDRSGLFKNNPGTCLLPTLPFLCHSRAGGP